VVKGDRRSSEEILVDLGVERRRVGASPEGRRECWSLNSAAVLDRLRPWGSVSARQSTPRAATSMRLRTRRGPSGLDGWLVLNLNGRAQLGDLVAVPCGRSPGVGGGGSRSSAGAGLEAGWLRLSVRR